MLLTNTQVFKLCKAFANNSSAIIKLSKTQLHKIGQSGGCLGRLLKSKVDKLYVDKLVCAPVDFSKLSDVVKTMFFKKMYITLRSKILKIKYLILIT